MAIRDLLLPEFDQEMAVTRPLLLLVSEELREFRPHAKSWTTGELALHLSNLPTWVNIAIENETYDIAPPGGDGPPRRAWETAEQMIESFDTNVAAARGVLQSVSDERMTGSWSLLRGGTTVLTMPRVAVVRTFVMNHMIHHRGQLSVFLRIQDQVLPEIYGQNADSSA